MVAHVGLSVKTWHTWALAGLLALNLLISVWAAVRPVVPVASLTQAIYAAGGDARVYQLRIQQLEAALRQAGQENEQLREELKKAKEGGK